MSYNNIGLATARGSGTNGYVQRNLSNLRPREEFKRNVDSDRAKHRQPDEGILEHERKRKMEVRCMELRIQLEDAEVGEAEIEDQVASLRSRLQESYSAGKGGGYTRQEAKALRPSDTHALGAAKADESEKMSRALGIRSNYREGDAFDRDLQEKLKMERMEERKRREEDRIRAAEERERLHRQRREEMMRQRMREEDDRREFEREMREKRRSRRSPSPSSPHRSKRTQSPSPIRSARRPRNSRSRSPVLSHRRAQDDLRSSVRQRRSPHSSRSISPAPRRARRDSYSPPPRRSRPRSDSRSPPPRRSHRRSPSPPRARTRRRSPSFSPSISPSPSPSPRSRATHSPPARRRSIDTEARSLPISVKKDLELEDSRGSAPGPPPGPPPVRPPGM